MSDTYNDGRMSRAVTAQLHPDVLSNLKWEDEPIKVEITIKEVKE